MFKAPRKLVVAVVALVVLVGAGTVGRSLLTRSTGPSTTSRTNSTTNPTANSTTNSSTGSSAEGRATSGVAETHTAGEASPVPAEAAASPGLPQGLSGTASSSGGASTGSALPRLPMVAIAPQIVRTATIDLRVGKNALSSSLTDIATLAATDGGYVESSSMAGGTARTSPLSGSIVIRVLDSDFSDAMAALSGYGKVTDQMIHGQDVTNQVSSNAATIEILQDEVNLLQGKLAQATDITTFLQIQDQLFPVEQQLQQLENQQTVLENSAALATITTNLSAPGAPLVSAPPPRPTANSATTAWRYLRHNSLAVLDGLVVGGGWALPGLALLAVIGLVGTRIARRRRRAINPA